MYGDKFRNVEKYIAIAKEKDKDCKVFGACRHRYKCNPVASMEDVKAFEKKTGLKLPENYVYFLTHIGNGGAGPHYGMYSLEELGRFHNEQDPIREADRKAFLDEKMTLEMWKNTMDGLDEEDLTDDDWDETINMVMAGALNIGTQGCTFETLLMCKGSEIGKIVYIDTNFEGECPPYFTGMTFEEWYTDYFKAIAMGIDVSGYGSFTVGTEQELMNWLKQEKSIEKKKKCLCGLRRLSVLSEETISYIETISEKELDGERLRLLLTCDEERGKYLFEKLINGDNPVAAANCLRLLPDDLKYKYYDKVIDLLCENGTDIDFYLIYLASDAPQRSMRDFQKILENRIMEDYKKKTVYYAMLRCPDAKEHMGYFVQQLREGDYHTVEGILSGLKSTNLYSEELAEVLDELLVKFKEYPIIRREIEYIKS